MVVGTKDGRVHLSIYDSFIVGSFESPLEDQHQKDAAIQLLVQASNMHYSTHALLFGASQPNESSVFYFVPMDLRFVSASSGYLSLLASKSTALQNLLRYVDQVQILMGSEWETMQDLPRKFLRNINETLAEKNGCDIVQAMYHSVATGHTFPAIREWLVDELAERV
jgi:anaphase-promoting complex subunit 4